MATPAKTNDDVYKAIQDASSTFGLNFDGLDAQVQAANQKIADLSKDVADVTSAKSSGSGPSVDTWLIIGAVVLFLFFGKKLLKF